MTLEEAIAAEVAAATQYREAWAAYEAARNAERAAWDAVEAARRRHSRACEERQITLAARSAKMP